MVFCGFIGEHNLSWSLLRFDADADACGNDHGYAAVGSAGAGVNPDVGGSEVRIYDIRL